MDGHAGVAWRGEHTPDDTWKLVSFIRHVPLLTERDLNAMPAGDHDSPADRHDDNGKRPDKTAHPHR